MLHRQSSLLIPAAVDVLEPDPFCTFLGKLSRPEAANVLDRFAALLRAFRIDKPAVVILGCDDVTRVHIETTQDGEPAIIFSYFTFRLQTVQQGKTVLDARFDPGGLVRAHRNEKAPATANER